MFIVARGWRHEFLQTSFSTPLPSLKNALGTTLTVAFSTAQWNLFLFVEFTEWNKENIFETIVSFVGEGARRKCIFMATRDVHVSVIPSPSCLLRGENNLMISEFISKYYLSIHQMSESDLPHITHSQIEMDIMYRLRSDLFTLQ